MTDPYIKLAREIAARQFPGRANGALREFIYLGRKDDLPVVQAVLAAIRETTERAAKLAGGWEIHAAGDDYMTDGRRFWDAGNVYDQARHDAAAALRARAHLTGDDK